MATPNLNPRGESVLRTLIEAYLEAGEPVGSRLLAKRFPEPLSSATIRNVLADLEDESLVAQPHTSAGRVPTERAYRYYVDRWLKAQPPDPDLADRLAATLEGLDLDPESWARHASRTLAEVMGGVCVALPLPLTQSRLVRLEFVPVGPGRLVAIWVGSLGEVDHRLMDNPWNYADTVLTELGNYATAQFAGLTLAEMRSRLLDALRARAERLLLRLAVGAATERLWLSYPRIEIAESRPRVPSFYALDVMRAVTGRIPNHEDLQQAASTEGGAGLSWPAPEDPARAIDDLEHVLHRPARTDDVARRGALANASISAADTDPAQRPFDSRKKGSRDHSGGGTPSRVKNQGPPMARNSSTSTGTRPIFLCFSIHSITCLLITR